MLRPPLRGGRKRPGICRENDKSENMVCRTVGQSGDGERREIARASGGRMKNGNAGTWGMWLPGETERQTVTILMFVIVLKDNNCPYTVWIMLCAFE